MPGRDALVARIASVPVKERADLLKQMLEVWDVPDLLKVGVLSLFDAAATASVKRGPQHE